MGEIRYSLNEALKKLNMNPNQLHKMTKIRKNTIYSINDGEAKRVSVENLQVILDVLNNEAKLQGVKTKFTTNDILEYIEDK